ncbi:hypothetical protein [Streptomyces sp. CBMA156]|uniref:hypothetical protein n=1 Tax=Streptomyces sp. CBMA156 TaxID=1930280 RepID=UPI001661C433|nr:hypothetical protein [Streptomyces sp. CBMA156]MBD0670414.1 hypothetical protein [Streptomyces sp. CBMA156]
MSTALIEFIAATMLPRLNNPAHPHSLPKLLTNATVKGGTKLLPVTAEAWNLGTVDAGVTPTNIADQWYQAVVTVADKADPPIDASAFKGVPLPSSPQPSLALSKVTITGLENVEAGDPTHLTETTTGYSMTVPLTFGTLTDPTLPQQIVIVGHYQLDQDVCGVDKATNKQAETQSKVPGLKWPVDHVTGTGAFSLAVTDLAADIDLHTAVTGTASSRALTVVIDKITPRGRSSQFPTYTLDPASLTIDQSTLEDLKSIWHDMAVDAFKNKDVGGDKLTTALSSALNTADTLNAVSTALTDQLATALDHVMGPVTGTLASDSSATNPVVDQYLFDRLRTALADENSPFYLPALIAGTSDPVLEPYTLEQFTVGEIALGAPYEKHPLENVTLDGTVTGFSNAVVPVSQAALDGGRISATVNLATLPGKPPVPGPPWKAEGSLTCDWGNGHGLTGIHKTTAAPAALSAELSFGGEDLDHLSVTVESVRLDAKDDDLTITVALTNSVIANKYANDALEQPDMKHRVLAGLNKALDDRRPEIGKALAKVARTGIAQRLDKPE